jgi:hypothetical protein
VLLGTPLFDNICIYATKILLYEYDEDYLISFSAAKAFKSTLHSTGGHSSEPDANQPGEHDFDQGGFHFGNPPISIQVRPTSGLENEMRHRARGRFHVY